MIGRNYLIEKASCVLLALGVTVMTVQLSAQQITTFPFEYSFLLDDGNAQLLDTYVDGLNGGNNPPVNAAAYSDGEGLLLTSANPANQGGAVYMHDQKFSSADGIIVEFEYMTYGGTGGDGLSVFLFDASVTDGGNIPRMGAAGAGIGYAYNRAYFGNSTQRRYRAIGLDGAYMGIALDSYGNFKGMRFQGESRVNGIYTNDYTTGGDNHVTIRGARNNNGIGYPGMEAGFTGYPVLITQGTTVNKGHILDESAANADNAYVRNDKYTGPAFSLRGGSAFTDPTDPGYRKAIIRLEPNGDGGYFVTVKILYNDNVTGGQPREAVVINKYNYKKTTSYFENAIPRPASSGDNADGSTGYTTGEKVTYNTSAPAYFLIGFAAATGSGTGNRTDRHVIKHLRISTPYEAVAQSDSIKNHPAGQDAFFYVYKNDSAYQRNNPIPDSIYIDVNSFRFIQESSTDTVISAYDPSGSGQLCVEDIVAGGVKRGDWCYEAASRLVTFRPDPSYTFTPGERLEIKYDMAGIDYPSSRSNKASIILEIEDCPPIVVWLGNSTNWDDPQNWYPNQVPRSCSDVYIPGNVSNFPSLISTGSNICNNIYFLSNAQLGQPQFLTYVKAYIQLDMGAGSQSQVKNTDHVAFVALGDNITTKDRLEFGAGMSGVTLPRDRWNMLSMPVKGVVTGDVAFGGYPFTYLRKFEATADQDNGISFMKGRWSTYFQSLNEELHAAEGFIYWVNGYKDERRYHDRNILFPREGLAGNTTFGLGEMNGVLQLPYYEDNYLSPRHRNHEYNAMTSTSSFHYFWQYPVNDDKFLTLTGEIDEKVRANDLYRFIAESGQGASRTMDVDYNAGSYENPDGEFVLLGNPYMSALDFAQFRADNAALIKPGYQIWTGNTFYPADNTEKIAPMQSFLVELNSTAPANSDLIFNFDVAKVAVTQNGAVLKAGSDEIPGNQLDIYLNNENGTSYTSLRQREDADNAFCDLDMSKIIEYPITSTTPEVYSLAKITGTDKMKALVVNSIRTDNITIPVGVATKYSGAMNIVFKGMDKYKAALTFIDTESEKEIDITGLESFQYDFTHTAVLDAEGNGTAIENRFLLRISPEATSIYDPSSDDKIVVYMNNGSITIMSSADDNIKNVQLYDVNGRLLYQDHFIDTDHHKIPVLLQDPVNILKVQTHTKTKTFKIIK